jgi:hypothetical protein
MFIFFIFSFRKQQVEGGGTVCAALQYEGTSKRNYDKKKKFFSEAKFSGEEELDLAGCSIMGQMSWGFRQAMSSRPLEAVGGFKPMKWVQWTKRFGVSGVEAWEKKGLSELFW